VQQALPYPLRGGPGVATAARARAGGVFPQNKWVDHTLCTAGVYSKLRCRLACAVNVSALTGAEEVTLVAACSSAVRETECRGNS
jgi:hypothetical protein